VSDTTWDQIAQNESGQDWCINHSSDGLSVGGLQFQNPSWQGALQYLNSQGYDTSGWTQILYQGMPRSQVPTKAQQITAGEALLKLQPNPWAASTGGLSQSQSVFNGGPTPAEFITAAQSAAAVGTCDGSGGSTGSSTGGGDTPPTTTTGAKESAAADAAISYAKTKLGDPYVWGGTGPNGFDCSGLIYAAYVYGAGQSSGFPRDTLAEYSALPHISDGNTIPDDILPGDLILMWFSGTSQPDYVTNHVTMYIGDGKQIEASGSHGGVAITDVAGRGGRVVAVVRPTPADSTGGTTSGDDTGTTTPPPADNPPPASDPTPPAGSGWKHHDHTWTYTVKSGDTLWGISRAQLGYGKRWHEIYEHSTLKSGNPHWIYPGEKLNVPD